MNRTQPPPPSDRSVFVYGSLKPGGRYWPEFCASKVDTPQAAKIRGELYDLHLGYPGLRRQGEGWVHGYILSFKNESDFLKLDKLEGYNPNESYSLNEYIRLKTPAYSTEGKLLAEVWTYEITEHFLRHCQGTRILNGNWQVFQKSPFR